MTVEQIITVASKRTENRGAKTLVLEDELLLVIQELCLMKEWEWRHRTSTFDTLADGTAIYDLTDAAGANIQDLQKIDAATFASSDKRRLDRVYDSEDQASVLDTDAVPDQPERYFPHPNIPTSIVLDPPPGAIVKIRVLYWACPQSLPEDGKVPLVPFYLHPSLVKGLERTINKYTLPAGDSKYATADKEYKEMVANAS